MIGVGVYVITSIIIMFREIPGFFYYNGKNYLKGSHESYNTIYKNKKLRQGELISNEIYYFFQQTLTSAVELTLVHTISYLC